VFIKDLVTGGEALLARMSEPLVVDQWTPDGRSIIVRTQGRAVYAVPLIGDRTPRLLVDTPYLEDEVHVSPDGRWVAFNSNESGAWEVYVAAFPSFTSKRQLSHGGGVQPQWRADGRELFYLAADGAMMSVDVDLRHEFTARGPVRLFPSGITFHASQPQYAVTSDGQRFLALERAEGETGFTVIANWRPTNNQ
jgi:Tol biopolymer transport system component